MGRNQALDELTCTPLPLEPATGGTEPQEQQASVEPCVKFAMVEGFGFKICNTRARSKARLIVRYPQHTPLHLQVCKYAHTRIYIYIYIRIDRGYLSF